jgi:hypothetical protein
MVSSAVRSGVELRIASRMHQTTSEREFHRFPPFYIYMYKENTCTRMETLVQVCSKLNDVSQSKDAVVCPAR